MQAVLRSLTLSVIYPCLLLTHSTRASKAFVISGNTEHERYVNVSSLAGENLSTLGYQTKYRIGIRETQRQAFKIPFVYRPIQGSANLSATIREDLQSAKPDENLVFFFNDHGVRGTSPLSSGLSVAGWVEKNGGVREVTQVSEVYTHQNLLDDIRKFPKQKGSKKFIGIHCFSGGLHEVAQSLPNACSAAASTYNRTTVSPDSRKKQDEINLYAKGFFEETSRHDFDIDQDSRPSLLESHLAGLVSDPLNIDHQNLSSFDLVLKTLKLFPYDPHGKPRELTTAEYREERAQRSRHFLKDLQQDDEVSTTSPPPQPAPESALLSLPNIDSVPENIRQKFLAIDKIADKMQLKRKDNPEVMEVLGKIKNVEKKLAEIGKLKVQVNDRYEEAKKAGDEAAQNAASKEYASLLRQSNTVGDELYDLKWSIPLEKYSGYKHWLEGLANLNRFYQVATDKEKAQFESLLKCEMEPL